MGGSQVISTGVRPGGTKTKYQLKNCSLRALSLVNQLREKIAVLQISLISEILVYHIVLPLFYLHYYSYKRYQGLEKQQQIIEIHALLHLNQYPASLQHLYDAGHIHSINTNI